MLCRARCTPTCHYPHYGYYIIPIESFFKLHSPILPPSPFTGLHTGTYPTNGSVLSTALLSALPTDRLVPLLLSPHLPTYPHHLAPPGRGPIRILPLPKPMNSSLGDRRSAYVPEQVSGHRELLWVMLTGPSIYIYSVALVSALKLSCSGEKIHLPLFTCLPELAEPPLGFYF